MYVKEIQNWKFRKQTLELMDVDVSRLDIYDYVHILDHSLEIE
jgi:hypothetical protein